MEKKYSKLQLEDKALKSAAMYFGQELLPYLKVDKKIRRMLPTEQIHLEAVRATEDMLFEMEDDTLAHLEFESVEVNEDDLQRFRLYDAYNGMVYKKEVTTYVICSGNVKNIKSMLQSGVNTYRIIPLQMKQENAEAVFGELRNKVKENIPLTKEELAPLLLTPLMSGTSTVCNRILEASGLINSDNSRLTQEEKHHMESVLYAFACKFLDKDELNEVKEAFGMTVLGEMIWNDGREEGVIEGREEGSCKKLINMIIRKLQKNKTTKQIAEELEEELEIVERICVAAKQCEPKYDCDKIYEMIKE